MGMETNGIVPVMDMNRNDYGYADGFGGGAWWIIILFVLLGWNRNGEGYVTPTQLQNGFNDSNVQNKLGQIQQTITSGLCDGFYATAEKISGLQQNVAAESYATRDAIVNGNYRTQGMLSDLGYNVKDCCCTTNRNIDQVRFENAQNTCAITTAIREDGEKTRALLKEQEVQALRDQLAQAREIISNENQSRYVLNSIGRYVTNPPCAFQTQCGCSY